MIIRQKKDFENFLSRTGLIRQDEIKYYVYWVIKFLNYCNYLWKDADPILSEVEDAKKEASWVEDVEQYVVKLII